MRFLRTFAICLCLIGASSCTMFRKAPEKEPAVEKGAAPDKARPEDIAEADAYFKKGSTGFYKEGAVITPDTGAFVIELDQQRAYLYSGNQLVAVSRVSSGRNAYRTETGAYTIGDKKADHRSNLYGDFVTTSGSMMLKDVTQGFDPVPAGGKFRGSLMKYFMRFHRNGKPTAMGLHVGVLPGYPASHGCVRLPERMASWFYKNVPSGTPVYIRGSKYGVPAGTKQARPKRTPKVHPSLKPAEPPVPQPPPAGGEGAAMPAPAQVAPAPAETNPAAAPAPATNPEPAATAPPAPAPAPSPAAPEPAPAATPGQ